MPISRAVESPLHRSRFYDGLVFLLASVWLLAGVGKLVNAADFAYILTQHNLLPNEVVRFSWLLGVCEAFLGALLVAVPKHRTAFRWACGTSATLLVAFMFYLLLLPADTLRRVGCGCQLLFRFSRHQATSDRWMLLGANAALFIINVVIARGVLRCASRKGLVD